jgi:pimeloyl-ACP methyl ester carboxylesterase
MLRGILVLALALLCVALCPRGRACAQTTEQMLSRGSVNLSWFKDTEMDFQLVRSLGADAAGGGAVGEILTAAKGIKDGDPASWTAAFAALARRMEADGEARLERGHKASAMESFMRASSYYRAAEYYGDSVAPETAELGMKCRDLFLRGMQLSTWKTESVTIPFGDDDFLPGYFISPAKGTSRRKTLVAQSGFDGTAEEMYFAVGRAALERGYNVLLFEGPGQAGKRRFHPSSTFVPDLGPTIRAVMDFVLARPEVHPAKVGLYGASLGGYFVLSGAARDDRLGAVIANSPVIDMYEYFSGVLGPQVMAMFQAEDLTADEIRGMSDEQMPAKFRTSLLNLCVRYGHPSVRAAIEGFREYSLTADQLRSLSMPAMGMVSESEGAIPVSQARRFGELAPAASIYIFHEESGANLHCQLDNMPLSWAVALDWLDEQFR